MAKPIKDTPTLSGMDAVRFVETAANVKRISDAEKMQMQEDIEFIRRHSVNFVIWYGIS